jgi:hypothetical protein
MRAFQNAAVDVSAKNAALWPAMLARQKPPAGAGIAVTALPLMIEKTGDMFILASKQHRAAMGEQ